MATIAALQSDRGILLGRVDAALEQLSAHPLCDGRMAAVGYCLGGFVVMELARSGRDLAAAISVHGSVTTKTPAQLDGVRARLLVCHGALDPYSPPAHVAAFIDEMNAAKADFRLISYGGALHGFTHEHDTGQTPGVLYDRAAAVASSEDIRRFLADRFSSAS